MELLLKLFTFKYRNLPNSFPKLNFSEPRRFQIINVVVISFICHVLESPAPHLQMAVSWQETEARR